jgi:hypothetical protein
MDLKAQPRPSHHMKTSTLLAKTTPRLISLESKLDRALGLTDDKGKVVHFGRDASGHFINDDDDEQKHGHPVRNAAVAAGAVAAGAGALALRGHSARVGGTNPARFRDGTYSAPGLRADLAKGAAMTAKDAGKAISGLRNVIRGNYESAGKATGAFLRRTGGEVGAGAQALLRKLGVARA